MRSNCPTGLATHQAIHCVNIRQSSDNLRHLSDRNDASCAKNVERGLHQLSKAMLNEAMK